MTIDEAIAHEKKVSETNKFRLKLCAMTMKERSDCEKAVEEHEQLVEWLEELKELRKIKEDYAKGMQTSYATFMYNKAIDDFAEKVKEIYAFTILEEEQLDEIIKQLKAGE